MTICSKAFLLTSPLLTLSLLKTNNMNILVTGANGQLGNEMRIISKDTDDNYTFTDVVEVEGVETTILDITDAEAIKRIVKEKDIRCIVNCAAYTNVDKAESDEALCRKLNADAPKILAEAIKEVNGLLVQISTDYVFGGDPYNTPCREEQKGTPTGVYGKTKLEGEQNIEAVGCDYVIIRTAWLYSEFGHNFVKTMLNLTATKPKLTVVFDQAGTPTYAYDLAVAIKTVLADYEKENPKDGYSKRGIYHSATRVSAHGSISPRRLQNLRATLPATLSLATATSSPVRSNARHIPFLTRRR